MVTRLPTNSQKLRAALDLFAGGVGMLSGHSVSPPRFVAPDVLVANRQLSLSLSQSVFEGFDGHTQASMSVVSP